MRPLHVPLPRSAPLPTLIGALRGWASPRGTAGTGCPIEGSLQGHHHARLGGRCWGAVVPGADHPCVHPPQVIYKKFQIPCPLPEQEGNLTGSLNATPVSTSDYQNGYTVLQAPDQGTCTPSFFTLNSQVGTWGVLGAPGELPPRVPHEGGWSWCWQHPPAWPLVLSRPPLPQTAYTIPIMAFAFVCHPEVLPIYTELKE